MEQINFNNVVEVREYDKNKVVITFEGDMLNSDGVEVKSSISGINFKIEKLNLKHDTAELFRYSLRKNGIVVQKVSIVKEETYYINYEYCNHVFAWKITADEYMEISKHNTMPTIEDVEEVVYCSEYGEEVKESLLELLRACLNYAYEKSFFE